jgi:hypothetical protein
LVFVFIVIVDPGILCSRGFRGVVTLVSNSGFQSLLSTRVLLIQSVKSLVSVAITLVTASIPPQVGSISRSG